MPGYRWHRAITLLEPCPVCGGHGDVKRLAQCGTRVPDVEAGHADDRPSTPIGRQFGKCRSRYRGAWT